MLRIRHVASGISGRGITRRGGFGLAEQRIVPVNAEVVAEVLNMFFALLGLSCGDKREPPGDVGLNIVLQWKRSNRISERSLKRETISPSEFVREFPSCQLRFYGGIEPIG